ncbi:hypothetical protein JCM9534A_63470 [Catenuloplanes indicus JCM 9534]
MPATAASTQSTIAALHQVDDAHADAVLVSTPVLPVAQVMRNQGANVPTTTTHSAEMATIHRYAIQSGRIGSPVWSHHFLARQ